MSLTVGLALKMSRLWWQFSPGVARTSELHFPSNRAPQRQDIPFQEKDLCRITRNWNLLAFAGPDDVFKLCYCFIWSQFLGSDAS